MAKKVDVTGQRFYKLKAIEPTSKRYGKDNKGSIIWKFECDCGKIVELPIMVVKQGTQRSCGCLQSERNKEFCKNDVIDGTKISMLTQKTRKDNKLGIKGIQKVKQDKYTARIGFKGKIYYLGIFNTLEEAVIARKNAELKYFGEYLNKI